ncbi:MAG: LysM peptidoglycan-binding domain-containing protein [Gammaproteobacteria bacterium]
MVAIVSGETLGLTTSSRNVLGGAGQLGNATTGRNGEQVFVNSATGNLIIQDQDEILTSAGIRTPLIRTYNSQGQLDDDNGDNWRLGVHMRLHALTGTVNTSGSTITKTFGDGAEVVYTYSASRYISTDGDGAYDSLTFDAGSDEWTWTDGSARTTETYDVDGRLVASSDPDGNAFTYSYTGDLLTHIADSSTTPQGIFFEYAGTNLTAIRVVSEGMTQTLTRYSYDAQNRLEEVRVDLVPEQASLADGKVFLTTYTYDGESKRVASIAQGDGNTVATTCEFSYELINGLYRIGSYTDGEGAVTTFTYSTTSGTSSAVTSAAADSGALSTTEEQLTPSTFDLDGGGLGVRSGPAVYELKADRADPFYVVQAGDTWASIAGWLYGIYDATAGSVLQEAMEDVALTADTHLTGLPSELTVPAGDDPWAGLPIDPGPWSPPAALENLDGPVSQVLAGANNTGTSLVVWEQGGTLYSRTYNPDTRSWSPAVAVSGDSTAPTSARLDVDRENGNAVLTWVDGATGQIRANRYQFTFSAGGYAWNGPELIANIPSGTTVSDISGSINQNGLAAVLWKETAGSTQTLSIRRKTAYYWANVETVTTGTTSLDMAQLAVTHKDEVNVIWRSSSGGGYRVTARGYLSDGWGDTTQINTGVAAVSQLHIDPDPTGDVNVTWMEGSDILLSWGSGESWFAVQEIPQISGTASTLVLAFSSSTFVGSLIAWTTTDGDIYAYRWSDESVELIGSATAPTDLKVDINERGGAIATWRDGSDLYAQRSIDGVWQGAQQIASGDLSDSWVIVGDEGFSPHPKEGLAVWLQNDGTADSLYFSRYEFGSTPTGATRYYEVQEGDTWESIATALYGTSSVADELQEAFGNTTLAAGLQLADFPADLTTSFLDVPSYYTVQSGDTWASITLAIYGTSDANAIAALQAATGSPTLATDLHMPVPMSLNYAAGSGAKLFLQADIHDALGNVTTVVKDAHGQILSVQAPTVGSSRPETKFEYDGDGNVTSISVGVTGNFRTTVYSYDDDKGNLTLTRDAGGNTVTRTYSETNQLLTETAYTVADPDGAGGGLPGGALTTRYVYDSEDHLRFVVSAEGRVTQYQYNAAGLRTAALSYTDETYDLSALDAEDALTEGDLAPWLVDRDLSGVERVDYTYDFRGNLSTETRYDETDTDGVGLTEGSSKTFYIYDQRGQLISTASPRAADAGLETTHFIYDGLGRVTYQVRQPDAGNLIVTMSEHRDAEYSAGLRSRDFTYTPEGTVQTRIYDRAGRLIVDLNVDVRNDLPFQSYTYTYDANGRLRDTIDARGVQTHTLYDDAGRKTAFVDGDGTLTQYFYDDFGQLVKAIEYSDRLSETVLDSIAAVMSMEEGVATPADVSLDALLTAIDETSGRDPDEDQVSRWVYDDAGRLIYTIDDAGAVTQTVRDGAGRVTETVQYRNLVSVLRSVDALAVGDVDVETDADDRHTFSFYDDDGNISATRDAEDHLVEYVYDAGGRLILKTGYANAVPEGDPIVPDAEHDITTRYFYDGQGRQVGVLDGEGYLTTTIYDTDGNVSSVTRYDDGNLSYATGDTAESLADRVSPGAVRHTTEYEYDNAGRVVAQLDFQNTATTYEYDAEDRVTRTRSATNTEEERIARYRYNAAGQVIAELSAEGAALLEEALSGDEVDDIWDLYSVKHEYDGASQLASTTDQNGNKTLYYYDADNRLTHVINAEGEVSETSYDAFGRVSSTRVYAHQIDPTGLSGGLVDDALETLLEAAERPAADVLTTTAYSYTAAGRESTTSTALGNYSTARTDAFGDQVASIAPTDGIEAPVEHTYVYDKLGELRETHWNSAAPTHPFETRDYDAFGRLTTVADQYGNVSHTEYDRLGRVIETLDPMSNLRRNHYDAFARVLSTFDANNNETSYQYLDDTRLMVVTTPESVQVLTYYDRHGQVLRVRDGVGNTTEYEYDVDGRLTAVSDSLGTLESRGYDRAGRLTAQADANGSVTSFDYDAVNRLLTRTEDADGLALQTHYQYDDMGRVTDVTDPRGILTRTGYDQDGRVESVTVDPDGTDRSKTSYVYDPSGRVIRVIEGDGSSNPRRVEYVYDALGRRIEEIVDPAGLDISTKYRYDDNGNLVRKIDAEDNSTWYVYDAIDRLHYTIDALGGVTENKYDNEGRLLSTRRYATAMTPPASDVDRVADTMNPPVSKTSSDRFEQHIYDHDGREVYVVREVYLVLEIDTPAAPAEQVTEKLYDNNGNVISTRVVAAPVPVGTYLTVEQMYSVLRVSGGDHFQSTLRDVRGRVIATSDGVGDVVRNEYDAAGNVVAVTAFATSDQSGAHSEQDRVTRTWYDGLGRAVFSLDGEGYLTEKQYDDAGRKTTDIAYAAKPTVDGSFTLEQVRSAADAIADTALDQATVTEYDSAGRVHRVYDADYSPAAANYEEYSYDAVGNKISFRNKKGAVWTYEYDANRRLSYERSPDVALTTITGGSTLSSSTDVSASIVTHIKYDALGNVERRTEAEGTDQARVTEYEYDALGRQTIVRFPPVDVYAPGCDSVENAGTAVTRKETEKTLTSVVAYDTLGNAFRYEDVAGNFTYKIYDRAGHVQFEVDALNQVTAYSYDQFGNQFFITRYANPLTSALPSDTAGLAESDVVSRLSPDPSVDRVIFKAYDRLNRVSSVYQFLVFTFIPNADSAGGRTITRNPTTFYQYNAFGEVIRESRLVDTLDRPVDDPAVSPSTNSWVHDYYYYDRRGQKTAQVDAGGYLTTYEYDETGDVTRQVEYSKALTDWSVSGYSSPVVTTRATSADDAEGYDRETGYTYDRLNRKTSETRYNFEYTSISGTTSTPTVADLTTTFGYDALGNQTRVTDASGASTYTYYDVLGRVRAIAEPARDIDGTEITTTLIPLTEMKRDAYGNLVEQIRYVNTASAVSEAGYTAGAAVGGANGDQVTRILLDSHGRAIQTQDAAGAQRYASYTERGDVAKEWQLATNADGTVEALVTIHHYDALGQETSSEEPQTLDGTALIVTRQQDYNAFGEIYRKGINGYQETFDYDQAGRLWRTNSGDGIYKVYLYDLLGNATAEIRSREVELQSEAYPAPYYVVADLGAQIMRTETVYDALGRVVAQRLPVFTTTSGLATTGATMMIGEEVDGPSNPAAIYQQVTEDYGFGPFITYVVNPSATVAEGGGYYLNSSGAYVLDSSMEIVATTRIFWDAPTDASVEPTFEYRALGSTGTWFGIPVGVLSDGKLGVDVQGLAGDPYEYRVQYRRRTEVTAFAETSGTFMVGGESSTIFTITQNSPDAASEVAALPSSNGNGIITWAAPADTSVSAVLRVKLTSASEYTEITAIRSGGTFQANAQVAMATAGTYDYQVIYTRGGSTIAKATGQLSSNGATSTRVVSITGGGEFNWPFTVDSVSTPTGISNGQAAALITSSASQNISPPPTKSWSGTNEVDLSWLSIGSGPVKVEIDYYTKPWLTWRMRDGSWEENFHTNPVLKTNKTLTFVSGETGVTFSWSGANADDSGGITSVAAVRVYKETSPGVWASLPILSQSTPSSVYGRAASWTAPVDDSVVPYFEIGPSPSDLSPRSVTTSPSVFGVELSDLPIGTYSYRLTYRIGGRATSIQTGTLTIASSSVTFSGVSTASYPTVRLNSTSVVGDTVNWTYAKQNESDNIRVHYENFGGPTSVTIEDLPGSGPNYSFSMVDPAAGNLVYTVEYFHEGETDPYARMVGSVVLNVTHPVTQPTITKLSQVAGYPSGLIQIAAPSDAGDSFLGWSTSAESGASILFRYRNISGGSPPPDPPVIPNGGGYKVDLSAVPEATFTFEISYTRSGETDPYAYTSGTFEIIRDGDVTSVLVTQNPPPTQNPVLQSPGVQQTLDRWGNVIALTDAANEVTNYRYNQSNQLIETLLPEADVYSTAASVLTTSRERSKTSNYYDALGRLIGTRDANDNLNKVTLNAAGQTLGETHADGESKYYVYDSFGRKTISVDELTYRTWMTYDLADRLKTVTHEVSTTDATKNFTETYGYDEAGRRITETNGESETTKYYYDLNGNLAGRVTAEGSNTTYLYDAFGHKTREQDAIDGVQTWTVDYFGRTTGHVDLAGTSYTYEFDNAGLQTSQTSTESQNIQFYYDAAGHLTKMDDLGVGRVTLFDYDSAGRRARERTTVSDLPFQDTSTTYDEQGRIATLTDLRYALTYRYDAQGNRTEIATTYYDHQQAQQTQDLFYTYDSMNRVLKSQAANDDGDIVINTSQGIELTYDAAGQRKTAYQYGNQRIVHSNIETLGLGGEWHAHDIYLVDSAYYTETYSYDGAGRLTMLERSGENRESSGGSPLHVTDLNTAISTRTYDKASREITDKTKIVEGQKLVSRLRTTEYDDDSHLQTQTTVKYNDGSTTVSHTESVVTYDVDEAGVLRGYVVQAYNTTSDALVYTSTYENSYLLTDSYVDAGQTVESTGAGAPEDGSTSRTFNVNNELTSFTDTRDALKNRYFANNANGQALVVVQGDVSNYHQAMTDALAREDNSQRAQYFFFANGQAVGSFGQLQDASGKFKANFDVNYTPVSADYPETTPSEVIAQQGDTLRTIAARAYGDSSLWYLIAEENGRTDPDAPIDAGSVLRIPIDVVSLSNASGTFKPYDVRAAIGDTTPTQPLPPPPSAGKKGCGVIGQIIVIIVIIVVTYYTAGVINPGVTGGVSAGAGGGGAAAGTAAAGTTAAAAGTAAASSGFAATFAAGVASAAIGNIAGQLVGMAIGQQQGFNWKSLASSALTGGVLQGTPLGTIGGTGAGSGLIQGAVNSAVGQGVNIALGLQKGFSWREVAVSAVGAEVARATMGKAGETFDEDYGTRGYRPSFATVFTSSAAGGLAGATMRLALGGKMETTRVLADTFGNAIGNSIVSAMKGGELSAQKREMYGDIDAAASDAMDAFDTQLSLDTAMGLSNAEFGAQPQSDLDRGFARIDRGAYAAQQSRMFARDLDESIRSNSFTGSLNGALANVLSPQFEVEPELDPHSFSGTLQIARQTGLSMDEVLGIRAGVAAPRWTVADRLQQNTATLNAAASQYNYSSFEGNALRQMASANLAGAGVAQALRSGWNWLQTEVASTARVQTSFFAEANLMQAQIDQEWAANPHPGFLQALGLFTAQANVADLRDAGYATPRTRLDVGLKVLDVAGVASMGATPLSAANLSRAFPEIEVVAQVEGRSVSALVKPVEVLQGDPNRIAIIGRNMRAVESYTDHLRSKGYEVNIFSSRRDELSIPTTAREQFEILTEQYGGRIPDSMIPNTKMFQTNSGWAELVRNEGYTVVNLGNPFNSSRSAFFDMERQVIFGRSQ